MKKRRAFWVLAFAVLVLGLAGLLIPGSPIYLPDLVLAGGVYDGKPTRYWISALNSSDPKERIQAVRAAASIGEQANKAVPTLGKILTDDPDPNLRQEAALALSKMIPAAREVLPALIRAVEDKEAAVRINAVMALFRLKTEAKPAIPVLVKALGDENNLTNAGSFHHNIQELAALALGCASAGTTECMPQLTDYLKRANTSMMKEAAVRAIGEVGPEARFAEPLLIPFLKDPKQQVREAAAETLVKIGAKVPDVGPPPAPSPPPPGVNNRNRYPGGGRPRPQGGEPAKPNPDEKKGEDKNKPKPEDKDKPANKPDGPELAASEREYLWEIEHQGNMLVKYGFGPFSDALKRADRPALSALLAENFAGADLNQPQRVGTAANFLAVERLQGSGNARRSLSKEKFVARLLDARNVFANTPPQVKCSLMKLGPKVRGQLDGLWEGTVQVRMHGEQIPGAPAEVVIQLRYEIPRPTQETLARSGWLRSAEVLQAATAKAPRYLFTEVARQRGLDVSKLHDNWTTDNFHPSTGGIYVCDFNRDGILDVLVTDLNGQFLYQGRPDGTFEDVTARCGLPRHAPPGVAAWIDIDGDGWEDLLLGGRVWRNEGGRRFVDYTGRCELRLPPDAINVVVADYNRDGRLDLYVTRTGRPGNGSWMDVTTDDSNGNYLFRNNGNWKFEDVTRASRAVGGRRSTFTAAWLDANNDGWPDLHVINEFGDGVLLVNNGDGTFREQRLANSPADFGTMGLAVGDINNDGHIDIYCANMYSKAGTRVIGNVAPDAYPAAVMEKMRRFVAGSQLHLNQGGLRFEQVGPQMQVAAVGWAYGACLADLDNDGWLDIYATAGFVSRKRDEPDG